MMMIFREYKNLLSKFWGGFFARFDEFKLFNELTPFDANR